MEIDSAWLVRDAESLEALYGEPMERAVRKQMDRLDAHARAFIAASPFLALATQSPEGIADCSPRGDAPGFVEVAGDRTLLIPDRRGNNRLDSLRNIALNPAVGLLFLIPGRTESFRVNGHAAISRDPALCARFAVQGKEPRTVIVVTVREVYIHCAKALIRSDLWNPAKFAGLDTIPSFGSFLEAHTGGFVEAKAVDEDLKVRMPSILY